MKDSLLSLPSVALLLLVEPLFRSSAKDFGRFNGLLPSVPSSPSCPSRPRCLVLGLADVSGPPDPDHRSGAAAGLRSKEVRELAGVVASRPTFVPPPPSLMGRKDTPLFACNRPISPIPRPTGAPPGPSGLAIGLRGLSSSWWHPF